MIFFLISLQIKYAPLHSICEVSVFLRNYVTKYLRWKQTPKIFFKSHILRNVKTL